MAHIYLEGNLKIDKERNQISTFFLNTATPLQDLREQKIARPAFAPCA